MKKTCLIIWLMVAVTAGANAYISNYKVWTDGEILYDTDLNANFTKTNAALDSMLVKSYFNDSLSTYGLTRTSTFSDSLLVKMFRAAFGDSADDWLARDVLLQRVAATNDSINARMRSIILVPYAMAAGDSFYAGDSLTVAIDTDSPLGNAASLYVKSATGVIEKVKLFWDTELPNSLSKIDSVRFGVWTENTDGQDFAALYVRDDSTRYAYKVATDSTGSAYSGTARTLKVYSMAVANAIVGGRLRVEMVLQMTDSDSMFVSPIELVVTNR